MHGSYDSGGFSDMRMVGGGRGWRAGGPVCVENHHRPLGGLGGAPIIQSTFARSCRSLYLLFASRTFCNRMSCELCYNRQDIAYRVST